MVTRQTLLNCVLAALKAQPFVHALWLEGADAAGRADAYSDLDLWADVDAGSEERAFACIRAALLSLGPLDVEHDASHPHPQLEQRFYRVAGTPGEVTADSRPSTRSSPLQTWLRRSSGPTPFLGIRSLL